MTSNIALIVVIAVLVGCGTTLMLERSLTRILIGFVMMGNGVNLLFIVASGPRGAPPLLGESSSETMVDPLPQAMALTAIVITLGVTAFGLALAYRAWQLTGHDDVQDDVEDDLVRRRAEMDETSASFDDIAAGLPDEEGADEARERAEAAADAEADAQADADADAQAKKDDRLSRTRKKGER